MITSFLQGKTGYDKTAKEVDPAQPAFTRRRELFVGRLAMVGFASALFGEVWQGKRQAEKSISLLALVSATKHLHWCRWPPAKVSSASCR